MAKYRTPIQKMMDKKNDPNSNLCQAFLMCQRPATTTLTEPNPILGEVRCCQQCKDKMDRIAAKTGQ